MMSDVDFARALYSFATDLTLCNKNKREHGDKEQRRGLLPTEFKEQLQMALHIFLRPDEAAAIAEFFDPNGTGSVNGEYFVRWFLHSGNRHREVTMGNIVAVMRGERMYYGWVDRVRG